MPNVFVDSEVRTNAVQLACRAPSLHNSQPWQWVAEGGAGLQLFVDRSRILYSADKSGREAHISCGAVLHHLRVAMAAAGLCAVMGGSPRQIENAAEIAMEHHLGLTCDPVGGLVQIPCIERNAVAASTAVTAAQLAYLGDGTHVVSLDTVIETMRQTGNDMSVRYKETSEGGLAVNVVEC